MQDDNKIRDFSAADIEKYHKGLLSAKEMHDLEKAALDDPFLADALEGYAVTGVNASADIDDLQKRVLEKTNKGKIVPITIERKNFFPWLKVAAMIIVVAGAGILVYQFAFNKKSEEVAQNKNTNTEAVSKDSNQANGLVSSGIHEKSISKKTIKILFLTKKNQIPPHSLMILL